MNYLKHYNNLISRAKSRKLNCYIERHHIIPKCMGGVDDDFNLVYLTAREHFIAHLLLLKIYPKQYGLIKAIAMMCIHDSNNRSMNRMYGWLREKFSKEMSFSQSGELNSQYGKIRIHNDELQEEKRVKSDELEYYLNNGWLKGSLKCKCNICGISIATFMLSKHKCNIKSIIKSKNTSSIKIIKDEKIKNEAILAFNKKEKIKLDKENDINTYREYYKIYDEFGFEKFKEITNYKFSKQNLVMRFKRLLPEFKSQNGKKRGNKIE